MKPCRHISLAGRRRRQDLAVVHAVAAKALPATQDLANARLRAGLCPECGSDDIHKYRRPVPGDPGDVDGAADCRNCGWGY